MAQAVPQPPLPSPASTSSAPSIPMPQPPAGLRFATLPPEPGRLWIRHAPRSWEGPEEPWLDLAAGRLGHGGAFPALPERLELDDLVYLPPVPLRLVAARDALARQALAGGAPVLLQLLPGDPTELPPAPGLVAVVDLLPALLAGDPERLAVVPAWAAAAVWPLLPGIAGAADFWDEGCRRLAGAGVRCVQAVTPALAPGDRRRLAERGAAAGEAAEAAFTALFHRQPPAERDFARVAHRHGLAPFLARPLPARRLPLAENRRVAGLLALAAELWLRLGRPVEQAQTLFRAARWLDTTPYDVDALRREGNLAAIAALDRLARELVEEAAPPPVLRGEGAQAAVPTAVPMPPRIAALLDEYLAAPRPAAPSPTPQHTETSEPRSPER
jgi:hypothetical protein